MECSIIDGSETVKTKLESDYNQDYPYKGALDSAPTEYHRTLRLLREIVQNGSWPKTSRAQSSIIRPKSTHNENAGSFTIVNPKFQDGTHKNGIGSEPLSRANARFPELVEAVFELEESISRGTRGRQKIPYFTKRLSHTHTFLYERHTSYF